MARVQDWSDPGKPSMTNIEGGIPSGDITVTGNLTVTGTSTLTGAVTAPSLTSSGAIQAATIRGTTSVRAQGLQVDGTATFNNDVGIVNGAVIQNGLTVQTGVFAVNGNSTLGNDPGDVTTVNGTLTTGAGTVTTEVLNVTGLSTLDDATATNIQATNQLRGLLFGMGGAAAAARQSAIPDSGDATTNAILAVLRTFGFIAP